MRPEPNHKLDPYRRQFALIPKSPKGANWGTFMIGDLRVISSGSGTDGPSEEIDEWEHVSISFAARLNGQIPAGWRVCGENLQARHTISYYNLNDWFLVFAIFNERSHCLSWDDTKEWTRILELVHVKEVGRFLSGNPEKYIRDTVALHRSQSIEGFVIRNIDTFPFEDWSDNVAKFVYKHFEVPEEHWMHKEVVFNGRIDT